MIMLKLNKDLDHTLVVSRVLNSEKAKLGVDLARLKEEFDILDKAHKALKGIHAIIVLTGNIILV